MSKNGPFSPVSGPSFLANFAFEEIPHAVTFERSEGVQRRL